MLFTWLQLISMLVVILFAAQLFSNALEYFGEKIKISSGVTGSIFAAVSTALPETMIPILAIIAGTSDKSANQEISVGAILGAPLMLSTLSIFVMCIFIIKKRGINGRIKPENTGFIRDLNYFIAAFICAAIAMYLPLKPVYFRLALGLVLISIYVAYVFNTFKVSKQLVMDGHGVEPSEPLILSRLGLKSSMWVILIQLLLGLILLVIGAKGFINSILVVSKYYGVSALLLSLLIIPVATELPEKVNSVLWARKNKDTLAVGNITGAMVFQGTLLPALGILLTPWQPEKEVLLGIVITVLAAFWLRINASSKGVNIWKLFINGIFYLLYLGLTLI